MSAILSLTRCLSAIMLASFCCADPAPALAIRPEVNPDCPVKSVAAFPKKDVTIANHTAFAKSHYPERLAEFRRQPLGCGEIVMLGDSLTELHNWAASLRTSVPIRNRGIAGDTSDGVLQRLDEVIASRPAVVFLLIGTNDLWSANSAKKTAENIARIADIIAQSSPKTRVYVQTVFPIRSEPDLNAKVKAINGLLSASQRHHGFTLVDVHNSLTDPAGLLAANYTSDGVHLNERGYDRWVTVLRQTIGCEGLLAN